jgi:hypothetical protein
MKRKLIISIGLVLVFAGCSLSENDSKIIHPTSENIPTEESGNLVNMESSMENESEFENMRSSLKKMKVFRGSGDDFINNAMFGLITEAQIDSKGRVYILDENQQHIKIFTSQGVYVTTIGGEGKGPGEFEWAQSVVTANKQRLLINTGYRIEIFDISKDEIEHLESKNIERRIRSLCTLGDTLYVHNSNFLNADDKIEGESFVHMIHAYSLDNFEHLFSFGESYKSENPMTIDRLSLGSIRCNEASSTVSFMFERILVIHGYDAITGSLKWKTYFEGLNNSQVIEEKIGGRTRLTFSPQKSDFYDILYMETNLPHQYQLIQVDRLNRSRSSFGENREVLTFMLDTETGKGAYMGDDIPLIFALSGNRAVSVADIFSTAKVHEINFN